MDHPFDDEPAGGPEFRVWVDPDTDPPTVGVAGELDLSTCAPFRDALTAACVGRPSTVVLDVRRLSFIGSTGIREVVRALTEVERIEVRGASPAVRKVFEMVDLPRLTVAEDA